MVSKSDNIFMGGEIGNSGRTRSAALEKLPDNPSNFALQQFKTPVYEKVQGSAKKDVWGALATQLSQDIGGYLHGKAQKYEQLRRNNVLTDVQTESHAFAQEYKRKTPNGLGLTEATLKTFDTTLEAGIKDYSDDEKDLIRISASSMKRSIAKSYANEEKNLAEDFTVAANAKYQNVLLNSMYLHPEQEPQLRKLYDANTDNLKGVVSASAYAKAKSKDHKEWVSRHGEALIDKDPRNWQRVLESERFRGADADIVYNLKKHGERQADRLEKKIHRDTQDAYLVEKRISREKKTRFNTIIDKDPFAFTEEDIKAQGLLSIDEALALDHLQKAQKKSEVAYTQQERINSAVAEGKPLENVKKEYQNKFVESQINNEKSVEKMAFTAIDCKATVPIDYLENNIRLKLQSNNPDEVIDGARGLLLAHSENPQIVSGIPEEHVAMANLIASAETLPKEQRVALIENARKLYLSKNFADGQELKKISTAVEREITQKTPAVIVGAIMSDLEKKNNINPITIDETDTLPDFLNYFKKKGIHPSVKSHFEFDCLNAYRTARKEGLADRSAVYSRASQIIAKDWSQANDNGFSQIVKNHPHNIMPELKGTYAVTNYLAGEIEDCVQTAEELGTAYSDSYTAVKLKAPLVRKAKSSAEFLNQDLRINKNDNIIAVNLDGQWKTRKVYVEYDQHVQGRARFFFYERPDDRLSPTHYLVFHKKHEVTDSRGKVHKVTVPEDFIDCTAIKGILK